MTEPRRVRRWKTLPGHQEGPLTVAALLDFCVQERLHPDEVTVTGGHLQWTTVETDKERIAREAAQTASEERTNEWERKNLVRLIEKHGLPEAFTTSCACGHPEKTNLDHSFMVCHQHGVPPGEGTFTR